MTGPLNARGFHSTQCYLNGRNLIGKFDNGTAAGIREFEHFVYQASDTVGVLEYLDVGFMARGFVKFCALGSNHLRKARKDIQRCVELMWMPTKKKRATPLMDVAPNSLRCHVITL